MKQKVITSCLLLLLLTVKVSTGSLNSSFIDEDYQKYIEELSFEYLQNERLNLGYSIEEQQKITFFSFCLDIDEQWLYDMFYLECRHNHKAINFYTQAVGLIQFMPNTAKRLGTSTIEIYNMSKYEQLEYVYIYLDKVQKRYGKFNTKLDLYLAIFWPQAIGQLSSYQLGGYKVWKYNSGIDKKGNKDGRITVEDVNEWINYNIS